jgi:hypothetical protein
MQDSGKGPTKAIQLVKNRGAVNVSARKVAANRQNALKSTGSKTLTGKLFSRRNALKHGLFARHFMDFAVQGEDREAYEQLLNELRDDHQPIGRAEESEVERIAVCWWKLQRVWRHENALNRIVLHNVGTRELEEQAKYSQTKEEQEKAVILLLESAMKEIEVGGGISQEIKQRMFATMPGLESIWPAIEASGQNTLDIPGVSKMLRKSSAEDRATALAVGTAIMGVKFLEQLAEIRRTSILEVTTAKHVIPNRDDLDRILRYETATDRSLSRALDRLERLQRRRRGEPLLPPVSVRLTQ